MLELPPDIPVGALAAIDLDTHQVLTKTTAGLSRPMGIAILSDTLYVVNNGSNTVFVMDAISLTTLQTITVGSEPFGVALTSDRVYDQLCRRQPVDH